MRTFIQGGRRTTGMGTRLESQALAEDEELGWPLQKREGRVKVRQEMVHDVRLVDGEAAEAEETNGRSFV